MSRSLNIILFGQTGHGKSSVVNLIAGQQLAQTSNRAEGCTLSFASYAFPVNGRTINIWDTVGLDESEMEMKAIEQAHELIQNLSWRGGVDLLLFCVRGPRITATSQVNYRLFYEILCRSQVPIALVVTHLEQRTDMEDWWEQSAECLQKLGFKFAGHACVTGLPSHAKYPESRRNITRLLEGYDSDNRFHMPPDAWFVELIRMFGLFAPLKKMARKEDIVQVLLKRCRMNPEVAEEIAGWLVG